MESIPPELSSQVNEVVSEMREMLKSVHAPGMILVDFPAAIYFLPFLMKAFQQGCAPTFVLVVQNVLDAAFEDIRHIARYTGPMLSSEDVIDTMCLGRMRAMAKVPVEGSAEGSSMRLSPSIKHFEGLRADPVLPTFDKKALPCTVEGRSLV